MHLRNLAKSFLPNVNRTKRKYTFAGKLYMAQDLDFQSKEMKSTLPNEILQNRMWEDMIYCKTFGKKSNFTEIIGLDSADSNKHCRTALGKHWMIIKCLPKIRVLLCYINRGPCLLVIVRKLGHVRVVLKGPILNKKYSNVLRIQILV